MPIVIQDLGDSPLFIFRRSVTISIFSPKNLILVIKLVIRRGSTMKKILETSSSFIFQKHEEMQMQLKMKELELDFAGEK
jgi:hypothetical protein